MKFQNDPSNSVSSSSSWSSNLTWLIGMIQASSFSMVYFIAPSYILSSVGVLVATRASRWSLIYSAPMLISAILPSMAMPWVLQLLKPMLTYFDSFEMIHENGNWFDDIVKNEKHYILATQPHGVVSFNGIMSAIELPDEVRGKIPTAVADVVLWIPILKHVMGIFGLISASRGSLVKTLQRKGLEGTVVLYVGGIAELFLSDENEERLYLKKRKGFIKLSLQTGVDIVPIYMFGNTTVLSVLKKGFLATLSRKLGVSLTYMWGKWGLPIPRNNCKLLYVSGMPLGIPHIPNPTQMDIDKYHDLYCAEVQRLFEKYKEKVPEYKHKSLHIM